VTLDPSTGEVYAEAPVSGEADVDAALRAAARASDMWRDATPSDRRLALLIADRLEARAWEFVVAESRNTDEPLGRSARGPRRMPLVPA